MRAGSATGSLERPEVTALVQRLSAEPELGIFVGAGISVEAGLPSWSALVTRLLEELAQETTAFREQLAAINDEEEARRIREEGGRSFAGFTTRTLGLLGAAAVAKRHLGEEYGPALHRSLYRGIPVGTLAPGPSAVSIARFLIHSSGSDKVVVMTTNYDRLLEMAFEHELKRTGRDPGAVRSVEPGEEGEDDAQFRIVHLHGLMSERQTEDQLIGMSVVFSEDEFLADDAEAQTRRRLAIDRLRSTPHLFVGTSLTDTKVLSYLYESVAAGSVRHAAVAIGQGADADAGGSAPRYVIESLQATQAERLRGTGVDVVFLDTYCEASQFIREVELHRGVMAQGDNVVDYEDAPWRWSKRASDFEQAILRGGLLPASADDATFVDGQGKLQGRLQLALQRITKRINAVPAFRANDEHLAIHLWLHGASSHALTLAGQSDRLILSGATLQSATATLPSSFLVVEALCNGTVVEATDPALQSARWGSMIAVPFMVAASAPAAGADASLPAGVVVLASTLDGTAGLRRLAARATLRVQLMATLAEFASRLVTDLSSWKAGDEARVLVTMEGSSRTRGGEREGRALRLGKGTYVSGAPPGDGTPGAWSEVIDAAVGS